MKPRLLIDLNKIGYNCRKIVELSNDNNINIIGVTKVLCSDLNVVKVFVDNGIKYIGDSKIDNLRNIPYDVTKVLLRIPNQSSVDEIVKDSQISLNSNLDTIYLLNEAAFKIDVVHQIILMIDLGDLREGIYFENIDLIVDICREVLKLKNIKLLGIGTNLTCYGGVLATEENLYILVDIKQKIESTLKISLDIISGGNSSSLYLLKDNKIPDGINNLRVGETIILGRETAFGEKYLDLFTDAVQLKAEIIELYEKPSYPNGIVGFNAFGIKPTIEDKGNRIRAILNIGLADVDYHNLFPIDNNIEIIGASSDHLIIDVTNSEIIYKVGDYLIFNLNYAAVLALSTTKYIEKNYL